MTSGLSPVIQNMTLRQIPRFLTPWANGFSSRAAISGPKVLTLPRLPIFEALNSHQKSKSAIVHSSSGEVFTYGELLTATAWYKDWLLNLGKAEATQDLEETRVAILVENGYDYVGAHFNISSVHFGVRNGLSDTGVQ